MVGGGGSLHLTVLTHLPTLAARMQSLLRRTLGSSGRLAPRVAAAVAACGVAAAAAVGTVSMDAPPSALSPAEFRAFKLAKIEHITHNTALYRCAPPPVRACTLRQQAYTNASNRRRTFVHGVHVLRQVCAA